jgi:hypothetical protein
MPVRIIEPRPRPKLPPAPKPPQQVAKAQPPEPAKPIEVPPPEPPPKQEPEKKIPLPEQIVQQPDEGKNEVPPDTRFKSERDTKVEKEQVKRGEPKPGESKPEVSQETKPKPQPKPPAPPKPQPARNAPPGRDAPPRVAKLPTLDRLLPNAVRLAQEGYGQPPEVVQDVPEQRPQRQLTGGNDGLFIPTGPVGTLDYLPDVREGDITLLNTKAEMFAPFVRRVALRVFQNFWISLKKDLTSAPLSAEEQIQAEAVMDPRGEMIAFTITSRSSRITLGSDRRLQQACNVGFFDRNPPPGARGEDGNIHFLFATAIQAAGTAQGAAFWVQLAAGLK